MAHNLLCVRRARAKPVHRLTGEQFLQDGDRVTRHVDWVERFVGEDGVVDFVFVFAAEGRLLEKHLVDQNAKGPPVHRAPVFLIEQDLGFNNVSCQFSKHKKIHRLTSGAMNSGVPQKVDVVEPYHMSSLQRP